MNLAAKLGAGIYAEHLMSAATRWGIVSPADQARWLAQCSVESQGFTKVVEGLNYSPERLLTVFQNRNGMRTLQDAKDIVAGGQKTIAEAIYGGAWGSKNLGNTSPGDGWKFRGQGLLQTTGRFNYHATSWGCWGDDRLLGQPELLQTPEGAAQAAAWYYYSRKLIGVSDVRYITKAINGGLNALHERDAATKRALDLAHG